MKKPEVIELTRIDGDLRFLSEEVFCPHLYIAYKPLDSSCVNG